MTQNGKPTVNGWIFVKLLIVLYKGAFAEITMFPMKYTAVENANVSFTCTTTSQAPTTWIFDTRYSTSFINSGCKYGGDLLDTSQYSCSCPDEYTINITVKHLTRKDHKRKWSCENNIDFNRAISTTFVNVPVTEVNLTVIDGTNNGIVQAPENTDIVILCTSSFARPTANITLFGYINGNAHNSYDYFRLFTRYENDTDDLIQTKSMYRLNVSRSLNKWFLYCAARNLNPVYIVSGVVQLDIFYPPNGPPVIQNFDNGTTYKILETHIGKLVCSIVSSNPQSVLTWNCESDNLNKNESSINQTSKVIQWVARRYTFTQCICKSEYRLAYSMVVVVNIDTLFPAKITNVYLNDTEYNVDIEQLSIIENSTLRVKCIAEGNPQPNITWSGQREKQSVLTLTDITRNQTHNTYAFQASNVLYETNGIATVADVNKSFSLNVLYPPSVKSLENLSVIEGKSVTVSCEIIPGNPGNTSIRWMKISGSQHYGNGSKLFIARVNRSHTDGFICEASNTMVPTFGKMEHGIHNKRFYLDVLYPPEMISINSNIEPNHEVVDTINVIENTYLKIVCTANGNPSPSAYSWSGFNTSSTSELIMYSTRNSHGNITCSTMNRMTEISTNTTTIGTLNRTYFLNVLFPPDIKISHDEGLKEGDDITINCSITSGKTTQNKIYWLTKNGTELHNTSLTIRNLTRNETGNYTCQLKYSMEPTYGDKTNGSRNQLFYLNVQYIPEITSFFVQHHEHHNNVTVNENDTVHLTCIADSNPSSTMSISFNDTLAVKEIRKQNETKTLYHKINNSTCTDTGIYICSGSNSVSKPGQSSRRQILLYVNCAPRETSAMATERNISINEHESKTFSYSVFAYPKPIFHLYRNDELQTDNLSYWTHDLSNKLFVEWTITYTLQNVPASVYGRYTLLVNNSNGEISRSFFINHKVTVMKQPSSSVVGPTVGGTVGGVLAIVVIVLVFIVFRRRRMQKMPQEVKKTNEYQNMSFMEGCGSNNPMDAASSVYERLQNTGSEQEYQKLSAVDCDNTKRTDKVYENLRLSHQNQKPELGKVSSRNYDTDPLKKHNQSRV